MEGLAVAFWLIVYGQQIIIPYDSLAKCESAAKEFNSHLIMGDATICIKGNKQ